jgi:hypothetical protein
MSEVLKRPGTTFVTKLTRGERVVGLCTFGPHPRAQQLYVATGRRVYMLKNKTLVPLRFEIRK